MTALASSSIRPSDAHAAFRELLEQRRAEITTADGRLRPETAIDIPCPLCKTEERRPELDDRGIAFQRCLTCRLVYQSPRLRAEVLDEFYANSPAISFFHENILLPTAETRKSRVFAQRIAELTRRADAEMRRADEGGRPKAKVRGSQSNRRVLDVGCATGQFLELARARDWEVVGVEPNALAAEYCRGRLEIPIAGPSISDAGLADRSFDAVTMWEVVSHLFEPTDVLRECIRVLRPGGVLLLTTPNINGFEYRLLRDRHENVNGVLFLQFFSPDTLRLVLEEAGFSDIEISTPGRMDVENVVQAFRDTRAPLPAESFWRDLLLSDDADYSAARAAFQNILAEHRLSGHMFAAARKPVRSTSVEGAV